MTSATPKPRASEVCEVCGGRKSACAVLGYRPPGDNTQWQEPRAGEHGEVKPFDLMQELKDRLATTKPQDEEKIIMSVNWQKMFDQEHDMHAKVAAERELLRARERELAEALELAAHFLEPRGAIASLAPRSDASHLYRKLRALLAKHGR